MQNGRMIIMGITIEQLLKNKEIIKEKTGEKTAILKIKSFKKLFDEEEITIKSLEPSRIQELAMQAGSNEYKTNVLVIYNAVTSPNLKDKGLQERYDCKTNPLGIVDKLFTPIEVKMISDEVAILSRFNTRSPKEIVLEIKK